MENEENDESDDEIEVTAKEVFDKLVEAWLNEKFSPDLLETKIQLVECMLAQVKELEGSFESADKDLSASLQKVELERVKFVIASYLRERLKKIENNVVHILEEEGKGDTTKLSAEELVYAKSFSKNMQSHLNTLALDQMPANMQTLDQKKQIPRPNLDDYVFIKVLEKQDQVVLDPEEDPYDLEATSQHIVRFKPIAPFVETGSICLL